MRCIIADLEDFGKYGIKGVAESFLLTNIFFMFISLKNKPQEIVREKQKY